MSEEQNQEPEVLLENYGTTALPVPGEYANPLFDHYWAD